MLARARQFPSLVLVFCMLTALLSGCAELPTLDGRTDSIAYTDTRDTRLGRAIVDAKNAHPGRSAIYPLVDAHEAFSSRVLLARAAERSLDIQYYIWHQDTTGSLLFHELHEAAQRGVRVRLLLDDNNTAGLDPLLSALDEHPNIEVRLFNPFMHRSSRWLGYLTDFQRLNRRMHNKSLTADNQATIIGGRNIGNEYFDAGGDMLFADLDVLAAGPVVDQVSADFDRYWSSASSYPLKRIVPEVPAEERAAALQKVSSTQSAPEARAYLRSVGESDFVNALVQGRLEMEWARTRMISDIPAKGLGEAAEEDLLPNQLKLAIGDPRTEVDLISPYFVPTEAGVALFGDLAASGIHVRILTNSLEATDVAAVHSGYARWRKPLLAKGVELYEMKSEGPQARLRDAALRGSSSSSSLHAKTFAIDGMHVFIGSFNFDPRSARLNTEMGFVIESPALARRISDAFKREIPAHSYEVRLDGDGELSWVERGEGGERRHDVEPGTSVWLRGFVFLLSVLPIEGML